MAKLLMIGSGNANWRLPAETNVDQLRADIQRCMEEGTVLPVLVEMGDNPLDRTLLMLNGKALASAAVYVSAEPS